MEIVGVRLQQLADIGSCRPAAIRNRDPGYSISLDKKKQYSQSRLHTAPVGLAIT
jgi:hypothetical protein